jgi:hypothetical protein
MQEQFCSLRNVAKWSVLDLTLLLLNHPCRHFRRCSIDAQKSGNSRPTTLGMPSHDAEHHNWQAMDNKTRTACVEQSPTVSSLSLLHTLIMIDLQPCPYLILNSAVYTFSWCVKIDQTNNIFLLGHFIHPNSALCVASWPSWRSAWYS